MAEILITHTESETREAGRRLAVTLAPGATLALIGNLGAGKTVFVKGVAEGLGLDADEVSSPTFTLIQEYRGPRTLQHVDLYRISSREADDLGLDELNVEGAIVAIEWAEKLPREPADAVRVEIEDLGGTDRRITIDRRAG